MFKFLFKDNNKTDAQLEYLLKITKGDKSIVSNSGNMSVVQSSGNSAIIKEY